MTLVQQANLESGALYDVYTSVAADKDLAISYPGYATGGKQILPRLVLYSGGALVTEDEQGNTVTLPAALAGLPLPIAPRKLINAGTGATAILIVW